jgi:hypothetical protein
MTSCNCPATAAGGASDNVTNNIPFLNMGGGGKRRKSKNKKSKTNKKSKAKKTKGKRSMRKSRKNRSTKKQRGGAMPLPLFPGDPLHDVPAVGKSIGAQMQGGTVSKTDKNTAIPSIHMK